jgi:sugar transferase (PEP-CTERM/EpsH1 system associated)
MQPLLFLVHRIPFPPDKGDKIRSYHLLKHLLAKYQVYLGAFIDNENDWEYEKTLQKLCAGVFLQRLEPKKSTLRSFTGFLTDQALTLPYYANKPMQRWVDNIIAKENIKKIVVFSSAMAQFVDGQDKKHITRIIDFVDVDSDKWEQYSKSKFWPMSWIYKREAHRLLAYETHIAKTCNASMFVSKEEAEHFRKLVGESVENIDYFCMGVDTDYFSPDHELINPFQKHEKPIVFIGAMDYWANIDAVSWFAKEIFPQLRSQDDSVRFYIVGSKPTFTVQRLANQEGVVVTGRVADVRPYLAHANLAVAPMRIARGVQSKVLEAMAMGRPVLVTSAGAEGIAAESGEEWLIADSTSDMTALALKVLNSTTYSSVGAKARQYVLANYNWDANLSRLDSVLQA